HPFDAIGRGPSSVPPRAVSLGPACLLKNRFRRSGNDGGTLAEPTRFRFLPQGFFHRAGRSNSGSPTDALRETLFRKSDRRSWRMPCRRARPSLNPYHLRLHIKGDLCSSTSKGCADCRNNKGEIIGAAEQLSGARGTA